MHLLAKAPLLLCAYVHTIIALLVLSHHLLSKVCFYHLNSLTDLLTAFIMSLRYKTEFDSKMKFLI